MPDASVKLAPNAKAHKYIMMTFIRFRTLILLVALLAALNACAKPAPTLPSNPFNGRVTDNRALNLLNQGKPEAAADYYSRRAERSTNIEQKEEFQVIAAEILFDRAMIDPGQAKLDALPERMSTPSLQHRRDIVFAKSLLFSNQAADALTALPLPEDIESPLDRARVYETRAQSFNNLNDPDNELIARIGLENQLSDENIIDKNHQQIWSMLTSQPSETIRSLTTNVRGDTYQGWLALALAYNEAGTNAPLRAQKLDQWRTLFTTHPANGRFLPRIYETGGPRSFEAPLDGNVDQIAILLPLSAARIDAVAAAIRDGIITAHQNAPNQFDPPNLRFYDVGENAAFVRTAYQDAVNDGASAVIGPLRKEAVSAIVTLRDLPVPTLTLNTVDESLNAGDINSKVIQFGLSPEDEAQSAASRAIALSLRNAIVLQSDDSRGDREARAFQNAMFSRGGDVVHVAVLPKDEYDYSDQIREALEITQSDDRFRKLSRSLGRKLFFEPSIRNDVDVIFLAVGSEQARSIRPQLDFFYTTAIPRLGTSRIASADDDKRKNRDLNSIYYPDAPWLLRKSLKQDPLRQQILANFPSADGVYAKLYALGADAYKVITNLPKLTGGERLEGFTGDLELSDDGRVRRFLDWAQYQEGESVGVKRIEAEPPKQIRTSNIN